VITGTKIARQRQVTSNYPLAGLPVSGYEIHQGRTQPVEPERGSSDSLCKPLFDDTTLGMVDGNQAVWGTYLHGIFDNGPWRRAWLNRLRQQRGLKALPTGIANHRENREIVLDQIADVVGKNLDLTTVLKSGR
jgi:adenosylcobyric acid synthase